MDIEINQLINLCEQELSSREYTFNRHRVISTIWGKFKKWMESRNENKFSEKLGLEYCDKTFGAHDLKNINRKNQLKLRAIRMLISYNKDGDFEFRTPFLIRRFIGDTGKCMEDYLEYLQDVICLAKVTIDNKRFYLLSFNAYLENFHLSLSSITLDVISSFYNSQNYSLASKHNCNSTLRLFLKYAYDNSLTDKDYSIFILPDNYKKHCKIPTTYEEPEIKRIIKAINRGSATGKRDYLIILLASVYGWRSSDIVGFSFDHINWDQNTISFSQNKTGNEITYPLLSSIGNSIVDYLKNSRPDSSTKDIIVSLESARRGKKLCKTTIHSIVAKYMKVANIRHWKKKKHGPHALRHSLATNLLKKNTSIPIISTVLGHQNTESTKQYISVDFTRLKQCALPVPEIQTNFYKA